MVKAAPFCALVSALRVVEGVTMAVWCRMGAMRPRPLETHSSAGFCTRRWCSCCSCMLWNKLAAADCSCSGFAAACLRLVERTL